LRTPAGLEGGDLETVLYLGGDPRCLPLGRCVRLKVQGPRKRQYGEEFSSERRECWGWRSSEGTLSLPCREAGSGISITCILSDLTYLNFLF
jgi:hypothetical protein